MIFLIPFILFLFSVSATAEVKLSLSHSDSNLILLMSDVEVNQKIPVFNIYNVAGLNYLGDGFANYFGYVFEIININESCYVVAGYSSGLHGYHSKNYDSNFSYDNYGREIRININRNDLIRRFFLKSGDYKLRIIYRGYGGVWHYSNYDNLVVSNGEQFVSRAQDKILIRWKNRDGLNSINGIPPCMPKSTLF